MCFSNPCNLLGATAATFEGHGGSSSTSAPANGGNLHYQFGRVTPFAATFGTTMDTIKTQQNFAWAVKNPMTWVASATWTTQDNSVSYMWHDKNVGANTDGKSIFDPSPIGWRLPVRYVWSDFVKDSTITGISDNVATYTAGSLTANYYAVGIRNSNTGIQSGIGSAIRQWTSTPSTTTHGRNWSYTTNSDTDNSGGRAGAFPVRPVRE